MTARQENHYRKIERFVREEVGEKEKANAFRLAQKASEAFKDDEDVMQHVFFPAIHEALERVFAERGGSITTRYGTVKSIRGMMAKPVKPRQIAQVKPGSQTKSRKSR
jgi:hypothetical protein